MKVMEDSRASTFGRILEFCKDYKDAKDIAIEIKSSEATSRKYMKVLVDSGYVSFVEKSAKLKTMRRIKTEIAAWPDLILLDLCEKYRIKFAKETISANLIKKAARIAEEAAKLELVKSRNIGVVDKVTGARVVRATEYHWTRRDRRTDRVHASGGSLSMVIATGNF